MDYHYWQSASQVNSVKRVGKQYRKTMTLGSSASHCHLAGEGQIPLGLIKDDSPATPEQ
jgi:hypothetical protein